MSKIAEQILKAIDDAGCQSAEGVVTAIDSVLYPRIEEIDHITKLTVVRTRDNYDRSLEERRAVLRRAAQKNFELRGNLKAIESHESWLCGAVDSIVILDMFLELDWYRARLEYPHV